MSPRILKLALSWLLLAIAAFGVAAVFMSKPWYVLLVTIIVFIIIWGFLAVVEWHEWRQMTRELK